MKEIDVTKLSVEIVDLWMNQWLLLTSGNPDEFNMMTVAWGSVGCMWSKPFAQIVVRPQRYTYQFLETFDSFTLCAFPAEYRKDLEILGSISGRDGDKLKKTKLSLRISSKVSSPSYNEASLILECRKMYYQDIDPKGFVDPDISSNYANRDYHRAYFGEILGAYQKD